ncbi:MAG: hypothetical protein U0353_27300 [Sandaracinus sp.]
MVDPGVVSVAGLSIAQHGAGVSVRVPEQVVYVAFDDVFVGRDGAEVSATFPYASGWGVPLGALLALLGALLAWLGALGLVMARIGVLLVPEGDAFELASYRFAAAAQRVAVTRRGLGGLVAALLAGLCLLALSVGVFGASVIGPVLVTVLVAFGLLIALRRRLWAVVHELRDRVLANASPAMAGGPSLIVGPPSSGAPSPSAPPPDDGAPPT